MPPYLNVAIGQISPRKADYAGNLQQLGALFERVDRLTPRPQVLHLPETALTGYFLEGGTEEVALTAGALAADLQRIYPSNQPLDVVLGFYERWQGILYNSAMYVTLGGREPGEAELSPTDQSSSAERAASTRRGAEPVIRHVHRKTFLPTYGLFDEERFVERGHDVRAFATPWGRAGILVCEDLWHGLPATIEALDGAQVLFVPSAAPARGVWPRDDGVPGPATVSRWERLVRGTAEEHGVYVLYTNLVGMEAGKAFVGDSLIVGPAGDVRARAPLFQPALIAQTIDLADIGRARADTPLLADLRTALPYLREALARVDAPRDAVLYDAAITEITGDACRPSGGPPPLTIDAPLVERWLTTFVREELDRRGFRKAVVGMSGGVDSAVTAFLAAKALGPENVIGVRMPYRTSNPESLEHAQLVIDALGIESRTIDISPAVDGYLQCEPDADPARRGNVMARQRMIVLFDLSARYDALPLGTGNKTERLFGYFTWHADDSPPVNPLGDLFKTQVWALARQLGVPDVIVHKPASADLIRGQTDEADFGISYGKADAILNWLLAGYTPAELTTRGFVQEEVELVYKRLSSTHWKRRLPTVAMLSQSAIGESYLRPVDY